MDPALILSLCTTIVAATAYIVTTAVTTRSTREDLKELKSDVRDLDRRMSSLETSVAVLDQRMNTLETDVAEIKSYYRRPIAPPMPQD
jgi:uncharacterized protein YoxC